MLTEFKIIIIIIAIIVIGGKVVDILDGMGIVSHAYALNTRMCMVAYSTLWMDVKSQPTPRCMFYLPPLPANLTSRIASLQRIWRELCAHSDHSSSVSVASHLSRR